MCSELPREASFSQHLISALCALGRGKKLQGERAEGKVFFPALKCVLACQGWSLVCNGFVPQDFETKLN